MHTFLRPIPPHVCKWKFHVLAIAAEKIRRSPDVCEPARAGKRKRQKARVKTADSRRWLLWSPHSHGLCQWTHWSKHRLSPLQSTITNFKSLPVLRRTRSSSSSLLLVPWTSIRSLSSQQLALHLLLELLYFGALRLGQGEKVCSIDSYNYLLIKVNFFSAILHYSHSW